MWLTSPMVVQVGFLITRTNMQKEKKVRSYTRKTKSGKTVTVKAHTAKYDAAEEIKKMAKKAGAGSELADKKLSAKEQKLVDKILDENEGELDKEYLEAFYPEVSKKVHEAVMKAQSAKSPKEKSVKKVATKTAKSTTPKADTSSNAISQSDFKVWYHWDMDADPKNATALKVKKALIAQMGRKGYNAYEKKMIDSYTSRGHLKAYKECPACGDKNVTKAQGNGKSLPEIKIPEKPKLRDKNFSSKISDYNAALDYRHYREAVLRGDKKAISDAKYNLTGYLREEAESTPLTQKISNLTGIPLGASRDASKSSEKATKTKSSDVMSKSKPTDAPKSQRDSYERHVSSQISGGHQTLSQIMETLAASGKWSNDEKMRRAAQRIYDRQK